MYLDKTGAYYFDPEFQHKLTEELFEQLKNKSFIKINKKIFLIQKITSVISIASNDPESRPTYLKKEPKKIKKKILNLNNKF